MISMYALNSSKTLDVVDEVNVSFESKFDETGTYDETVKFDERDKFEFDCSFKDVFNASSVSLTSS